MKRTIGRALLKFLIPPKISVKLTLIIGSLVLVLLSTLGFALTQVTEKVLKENLLRSHEAVAVRAVREAAFFVNRPVELLNTAAILVGRNHADAWSQETLLVEMSLQFPMFEEVVSLDQEGKEIASSNPGNESSKDWHQEEAFQNAIKGNPYYSSIRVGNDYLPHVVVAVPSYRMGAVAGVLIAKVNLRGVWEITDGIKIGKTGKAFLIANTGLFIAHPDKKLIFQNKTWADKPFFKDITSGSGSLEIRIPDQPKSLISFSSIPGPIPMIMVIQMEASEAYQLLFQMRFLVWLLIAISLVVSMIVSFLMARWLVRPVKALNRWSKRVALGDFDFGMEPASGDELGKLFIRFKRMSKRLKAAREQERLVALGEAATTISHKLKNAIVSLKTFAQLLPQRKQDVLFMRKFETSFSSTVENLERMFKNLSQVASFREPEIESVFLDSILNSIRESYLDTMETLGIDCRYDIIAQCPSIPGDAEQLRELFVNLIQNAIHAMPQGGYLSIRLAYQVGEPFLQVSIVDNGTGIKQQDLNSIFKPFYTTKHGGMGLGLSISKKIVEGHGGSISVASTEGKGSIFTVTLPVERKQAGVISNHHSRNEAFA